MDIIEVSCKEFDQIINNGFDKCPLCNEFELKHSNEHVKVLQMINPRFGTDTSVGYGMTGGAGPAYFIPATFFLGQGMNAYLQLAVCICTHCKKLFGVYCDSRKETSIQRQKDRAMEQRNMKENDKLFKNFDNDDARKLKQICNQVGVNSCNQYGGRPVQNENDECIR